MQKDQDLAKRYKGCRAIDASDARKKFRDVVDEAASHGRRIIVQRNGRPLAAFVSLRDLDFLLERDRQARLKMRRVPVRDDDSVPFEQFTAEASDRSRGQVGRVAMGASVGAGALCSPAVEAAMTALTQAIVPNVVRTASELVMEKMNERLGKEHTIDEDQITEEVLFEMRIAEGSSLNEGQKGLATTSSAV